MTCTCRKDIEEKLLQRFKESSPEATDHHVCLQGYALVVVDSGLRSHPYMPFKTMADFPLKKGGTKTKSTTQSMIFNYCPFCGTSLKGEAS